MSCSDRKAAEEKARQDAEAQARADAARKEMQVLPQTFKPRYNQRLDATGQTNGTQTTRHPIRRKRHECTCWQHPSFVIF